MPIWRRLYDLARAEANALVDRAREAIVPSADRDLSGRSLEDLSDEELRSEIERRARTNAPSPEPPPAPAERGQPPSPREKQIQQFYANLELAAGSDLDAVKRAYRSLMRRYHPDRYLNDPDRHRTATDLAESLTRAYTELQKYLRDGR